MASNQELPKFRFGIRNLIILMVAGSFWLAAIFSNSNALAFAFSFICFLAVILGSTINLLGKKFSEHRYWFFMVSTLLTAFILMIMIGHQINVAKNFEGNEYIDQSIEYPGPAKITSDDHVQVWRWGLIWLPACLLFAWLIAFPAALVFKHAGLRPPGLTNQSPPDIQFLDSPADDDRPDRA